LSELPLGRSVEFFAAIQCRWGYSAIFKGSQPHKSHHTLTTP
jgi:hypothetical protein